MHALKPLLLIFLLAVCLGCPGPSTDNPPAGPATKVTIYQVRGIVMDLLENRPAHLQIKHEAIPGFMEAMTMDLRLEDPKQVELVQVGAEISFEMIVSENDAFIRINEVLKQGDGTVAASQKLRPITAAEGQELKIVEIGEAAPDITLWRAMDEKKVALSDYRGKYVLISFMFTSCPYPTACPLMAKNMKKVQDKSLGLGTELHQLSITIDPEKDTAQVLRNYGKQFGADPKRWNFLYGPEETIAHAAYQLNVDWYWGDNTLVHKLVSSLVAPDGTLIAQFGAPESWDQEEIIQAVRDHLKDSQDGE